MQKLYTNHKRATNQHNNMVLGKNFSQTPKGMRQEFEISRTKKIISDDLIQMFEKYYNRIILDHDINDYHMAEYTIKKIQNQGVEILEYTNQLHPLYETCITNHIDQKIKDFHEFPNNSSYKVIAHTIHKAKESGVDVEQYETLLPILKKEGLVGTLHQKLKACIVNDSMQNILGLKAYMKELIALGIFIGHQSIKEELNATDLELYTLEEKNGILGNIHKHASNYQETKDINELDILLEELFLAEQLGIDIDLIQLATTLGLPIKDEASQGVYVHELLDVFEQYIANPIDKEEKRRLSGLITIFS